jgi:hypothetical protein
LGGSVDEYIVVGGSKERQYMYNVALRSVRATIVVVEEQ